MAQISGILLFVVLMLLETDLRDLAVLSKHSATRLHPWLSIAFCRWPWPVPHFLNMPGLIHATFGAHEQWGLDLGVQPLYSWFCPAWWVCIFAENVLGSILLTGHSPCQGYWHQSLSTLTMYDILETKYVWANHILIALPFCTAPAQCTVTF